MREIKFRAWDKKENKMQQVVQILYGHEASNYPLSVDFFRSVKSRLIEDIELMQYTGLKDKNGVEIYEGDIIKMESGITQLIKFGEGLFEVWDDENTKGFPFGLWNINKDSEVIGNIYENKELLK